MKSIGLTTSRIDVFRAIDTERDYQESLTRNTENDQRPLEQLAIIEELCRRAKADWYDKPGPVDMNYVRKIAGVAVRCMEQHGAPTRPTVPWRSSAEKVH
jgi:hypothetical protein